MLKSTYTLSVKPVVSEMNQATGTGTIRRVVVTGLGLVTPLGSGVDFVWKNTIAGVSGIQSLIGPKYDNLPCRVAGIVPKRTNSATQEEKESSGSGNNCNHILDLSSRFSEAERRSSSQATLFALVAADEAIAHSKILDNEESLNKGRIGVCVGMGLCDLQDIQDTGGILEGRGYSRVTPYFIPRILPNLAAGQISIKYKFEGPNHCASTACASGAHAIGDAFNFIRHNYADAIVCGGAESSINPLSIASFCRLRALSTKFNSEPQKASRPFDIKRDGFVMGEGAGIIVLEELNHALDRGASVIAEVLGYGVSGDAFHLTAAREDGEGALRAMRQALHFSNTKPEEVSYINCHATSTPIGDRAELKALQKLFQCPEVKNTPVSSTKGSHGHLLGAAGAVESIMAILACHFQVIPPSLNVQSVEKDFERINIIVSPNHKIEKSDGRFIALKNSFGFGGTNTSLCFSDFKK